MQLVGLAPRQIAIQPGTCMHEMPSKWKRSGTIPSMSSSLSGATVLCPPVAHEHPRTLPHLPARLIMQWCPCATFFNPAGQPPVQRLVSQAAHAPTVVPQRAPSGAAPWPKKWCCATHAASTTRATTRCPNARRSQSPVPNLPQPQSQWTSHHHTSCPRSPWTSTTQMWTWPMALPPPPQHTYKPHM